MLGEPVRPDPFPAMRLPSYSPDPRWWSRFFRPIRRLLFAAGVPTAPYRKKAQTGTPTPAAGKYRLRALQCFETAAQTRDAYAKDMLTVAAREFCLPGRRRGVTHRLRPWLMARPSQWIVRLHASFEVKSCDPVELLAEVPIAASLGRIGPIPAQVDGAL